MGEKLNWQEIEERYNQEWVELVDYDWPEGAPFPRSGTVRVHDKDRKRFHAAVKTGLPVGSALLYVGTPEKPSGLVRNNLNRISECK